MVDLLKADRRLGLLDKNYVIMSNMSIRGPGCTAKKFLPFG